MSATSELTDEKVLEVLKTVRFPGCRGTSFRFRERPRRRRGNVRFGWRSTESPRAAENPAGRDGEAARSRECPPSIRLEVKPPGRSRRAARGRAGAGRRHPQDVRFVASGKGGVGKSTVAANLSLAVERLQAPRGPDGLRHYGPSQQMMMGISRSPTSTSPTRSCRSSATACA